MTHRTRVLVLAGSLALAACTNDDAQVAKQNTSNGDGDHGDGDHSGGGDGDVTSEESEKDHDASVAADARTSESEEPSDGGIPYDGEYDAGPSAVTGSARPIAKPPTYLGSLNGEAACATSYATVGFEPETPSSTKHPLFLYFVGTSFFPADEGSHYDGEAARAVTEAMARRGFVALAVQYDNGFSFSAFPNKMQCLFGAGNQASLLARSCALPNVECDLGIATWGHSQGALVAHSAANLESRVRAVWTTGYSGFDGAALAKTRLRVVNGEQDTMNSGSSALNKVAGFTAAECPNDGRSRCLRKDGSGWILVRKAASEVTAADHCWFNKKTCADNNETLEPNWVDADSAAPFALEGNADWLARTAREP